MQSSPKSQAHGGVRGANLSRSSSLFAGPFGRMFRALPPAEFGPDDKSTLVNLELLAAAMMSKRDDTDPKDGPDPREGGIPAAYTYFGQFVDHDLTFDPASSLQRQNDLDALVDYRTPRFDLDSLYGRGPDDQPYMYKEDRRHFVLGTPLHGGGSRGARDLQRNSEDPARALIGDPRNDENVVVAQLHGLWQRFHNKLAGAHERWSFVEVQQQVRFHYQWILLHDFLPMIVAESVLRDVLPIGGDGELIADVSNLKHFHFRKEPFMPLEFSVAAYRFGHTMVRPGYRLNDETDPLPIFLPRKRGRPRDDEFDLRGGKAPREDWAIDWKRFIDLEPLPYGSRRRTDQSNKNRLQLAFRIDTSLVNPLRNLPNFSPSILALRNLERGWRLRLPSGQDVAKAMGLTPLTDNKIRIGMFTGKRSDIVERSILDVDTKPAKAGTGRKIAKRNQDSVFRENCPLWTYVLAETIEEIDLVKTKHGGKVIEKKIKTRRLGPVGGRIVAETFLGLMLADSSSYLSLNPHWKPDSKLTVKGKFGLREMISFTLK